MLDPVSAFGVAAATLQFLEFSIKTVAVSKAVGTKGSTDDILQLDTIYAHLKDTSAQLTQLLKRPQPLVASQVENELTRMAGLCHEECKSFLVTISDMKVKCTKRNGLKNFRQALRIVWNEKAIEAFETRLIRYQRELTLALVVQFR
ncbi:hypothetical protein IQ07DRAFT_589538 [Pyrenochaeta sp. DS3sAY3a]|nr:hypothetical protein IQ07DRAFT_589538 [Pyrenochaeta sp. DS3sAY3a]